MKRTQLNLDEKTYYQLVSYARREKTSISAAARKLLTKQISKEPTSTMEALLGLVELGKKAKIKRPHDLSSRIDYYLYGEGSPKFCRKKK